jgi:MFS family permease
LAEQEKIQPGLVTRIFSDRVLIWNLSMMILVWVASSFTFFLLSFLVKYMPGDIYFNSIVSGLSCSVMLVEGFIQDRMGSKGGMIASLSLTCLATLTLCLFVHGTDQILLYAFIVFLAKTGGSLAFGFAYAIHIEIFPSHFVISSFGICNFFCRGLTIFAPIVAEVSNPWIPMIFLNLAAFGGLLGASGIKKSVSKGDE